jgi:hypothetical protein
VIRWLCQLGLWLLFLPYWAVESFIGWLRDSHSPSGY